MAQSAVRNRDWMVSPSERLCKREDHVVDIAVTLVFRFGSEDPGTPRSRHFSGFSKSNRARLDGRGSPMGYGERRDKGPAILARFQLH